MDPLGPPAGAAGRKPCTTHPRRGARSGCRRPRWSPATTIVRALTAPARAPPSRTRQPPERRRGLARRPAHATGWSSTTSSTSTTSASQSTSPRPRRARWPRRRRSTRSPTRSSRASQADGTPAPSTTSPPTYAGSLAKALVLAAGRRAGPHRLRRRRPGRPARGQGRRHRRRPPAGSRTRTATFGDYANVIGQAFAVPRPRRGRQRRDRLGHRVPAGPAVRRRLLPAELRRRRRARAGLRRRDAEGPQPDTDATALAVLALRRAGRRHRRRTAALERATDWLLSDAGGRRLLRRRHLDRGAQHQQHRPRRLGARRARHRPRRGRERPRGCAASRSADAAPCALSSATTRARSPTTRPALAAGQADGITDETPRPVAAGHGPGAARRCSGRPTRLRPVTPIRPSRLRQGRHSPRLTRPGSPPATPSASSGRRGAGLADHRRPAPRSRSARAGRHRQPDRAQLRPRAAVVPGHHVVPGARRADADGHAEEAGRRPAASRSSRSASSRRARRSGSTSPSPNTADAGQGSPRPRGRLTLRRQVRNDRQGQGQGGRGVREPQGLGVLPRHPLTMRHLSRLVAAALVAAAAGLAAAGLAGCGGGLLAATGVTVVVDFNQLGGGVQQVCDAGGGGDTAASLFTANGYPLTYAQRQPGFVCRVSGVAGQRPVRQHLADQRLLGPLLVRRRSPGSGSTRRWAPPR